MRWQTIKVQLIAQATLVWMVTPTTHCVASSRPNAAVFTLLACVHLMYWQTIKPQLIAQATLVWMVTLTTRCVVSPRPNANITSLGCVHLMRWQTVRVQLIAQVILVWIVTLMTYGVASSRPNAVAVSRFWHVALPCLLAGADCRLLSFTESYGEGLFATVSGLALEAGQGYRIVQLMSRNHSSLARWPMALMQSCWSGHKSLTIKVQLIGEATINLVVDCASNPCVDGNTDGVLGCKPNAKCSSLYTKGMRASNALADNQGTTDGTTNLMWMVAPTTCCAASPRPNAVTFTPRGCVCLMHWQTIEYDSLPYQPLCGW